jgi:hypothetical protein
MSAVTYAQATADLKYWTLRAEYAEKHGYSRWQTTAWGLGGVCYGLMIHTAMAIQRDYELCDALHVAGAVDEVLQDTRRRRLLWQARQSRGVA